MTLPEVHSYNSWGQVKLLIALNNFDCKCGSVVYALIIEFIHLIVLQMQDNLGRTALGSLFAGILCLRLAGYR